jgi:hypothetical protein
VLSPLEAVYDELIQRRRKMGLPLPGPAWMKDPQKLMKASCAADALSNVIPRVRKGSISPAKGLRLLLEMLDKQPILDIARGAAMIRGAVTLLLLIHKPEGMKARRSEMTENVISTSSVDFDPSHPSNSVSVIIPVYNGARFIAQTVRYRRRQKLKRLLGFMGSQ